MRALTALEGRALGVLIEKSHTVPDSYPLSLNALTLGANQKTARDPVMNAAEGEVHDAIDGLKSLHLVLEASASRVTRYEHNMARALSLPSQSVALLATLLLRGPQTSAELRANGERLHRFADLSAVEGFLEELETRSSEKGGALVARMARPPGTRETRWVHLLGETPPVAPAPPASSAEAGLTCAARPQPLPAPGMRFELPDDKRLTLEMVIPIRWGDMDAMGHVNNAVYFRYLETIRIEWLHRSVGAPDLKADGPVIVNAFCNFIRQLKHPGEVLAKHYVANAGRSSFDTFITLERTDQPGLICASGGAKTVWINYAQEKSVPLPDVLRALIEG